MPPVLLLHLRNSNSVILFQEFERLVMIVSVL